MEQKELSCTIVVLDTIVGILPEFVDFVIMYLIYHDSFSEILFRCNVRYTFEHLELHFHILFGKEP